MKSISNTDCNYSDRIYSRDYQHDVPSQENLIKRIALASIPFLALHPVLQQPISMGMGFLRVVNSSGIHRNLAIASFALSIINPPLGMITTTIDDILLEIKDLKLSADSLEVLHHLLKLSGHLMILSIRLRGGMELYLVSCAIQTLLSLIQSVSEFKNDRWVEGIGHFTMTILRLNQLSEQWALVKRVWNLQKLIDRLFPSSSPQDSSQSSLIADIIAKRHSGKNFDETSLTVEQINALIEATRWTPSSYNDQPWNFIFCNRDTHPEAYAKAIDAIYGQEWVEQAPLLVISVVRPNFNYNSKENQWALYDTGAAALSMSLQAVELGLMAHQIGGFDSEAIIEDFHLPEGYNPVTIIAIGYEKTTAAPIQDDRTRLPIDYNFFFGDWGW